MSRVSPLFQRVRERRDLVFVDQRGTGESNPLECELYDPDDLASAFSMDLYPPEELRKYMHADVAKWAKIVKESGAKLD